MFLLISSQITLKEQTLYCFFTLSLISLQFRGVCWLICTSVREGTQDIICRNTYYLATFSILVLFEIMYAKINIDTFKTESIASRKEVLKIPTVINPNNKCAKPGNHVDWVTLLCCQNSFIPAKFRKQYQNWCQNSVSGVPRAVMVTAHINICGRITFRSWPNTLAKGRSKQSNNFSKLFVETLSFEIGICSYRKQVDIYAEGY